jgi:hypothetical protein
MQVFFDHFKIFGLYTGPGDEINFLTYLYLRKPPDQT